ncbi:DUF393 domain-containing protein [Bordetella avium]|uniref:DCC1-like thiol-disulfide oxidoreductase family protein n=1 Tax=Bordetella avium TaxID=521 RepID=UPI000FD83FE9|nr:DCC1-like thiol-disulfide oxidoreductase family protein [Bordetella avium]AZY48480.1 DUF393 domain-containing protein [Bordetella avium]
MPANNFLLYDGDCPFCSNYVQWVQLRKAVGPVDILDIREHPALTAGYLARGYDLDQGMLLHLNGQDYWGADCIHRLAMLSFGSNLFNRINAGIFRRPRLSAILYPLLRTGRNATLALLGRKKIRP